TLELMLGRTDRFAEFASVLRLQAATFETDGARLGAISELALIEEHRGIPAPAGAPTATELLRSVAPEDVLLHEAVLRARPGLDTAADVTRVTSSLSMLAAATPDAHHSATLELIAGLLLERAATANDRQMRGDALRRYGLVLDGWPECLTAARGIRRLAEHLG